jgi:ribosomal protein L11 methyltransferase
MWSVSFRLPAAAIDAFSSVLQDSVLSFSSFEVVDEDGRQIGDQWQIDLLYPEQPRDSDISAQLALIAVGADVSAPTFTLTPVPETDWVAATLSSFPPISIGRFWVHGSHETGPSPAGKLLLRVDAATAFGTGEHATTRGCLLALDHLAKRTGTRRALAACGPTAVLDVGCGTGILALAAARLWPGRVLASDIDPEAVRVAQVTTRANGLHPRVRVVVADGVGSRAMTHAAPYAVITANILARPLCHLAPGLSALLAPGGRLILSGLLATQIPMVLNTYRAQGLRLDHRFIIGEWATLVVGKASADVATSSLAP